MKIMKKAQFFLALLLMVCTRITKANNLKIDSLTVNADYTQLSFNISWDNSWAAGNFEFHDAVWVFVKYRPSGGSQWYTQVYRHILYLGYLACIILPIMTLQEFL